MNQDAVQLCVRDPQHSDKSLSISQWYTNMYLRSQPVMDFVRV